MSDLSPYYVSPQTDAQGRPRATLYCDRAENLLSQMEPESVDLIVTDPPYYRVKDAWWDRQWDKPEAFLEWMGQVLDGCRRVLKPNGSLYVFASPQMAWGVEGLVRERFRLLSSVRWYKDEGWHNKTERAALRSYLSPWEAVLFAEMSGADAVADDASGYGAACYDLHKQVYGPLGAKVRAIREAAGLQRGDVDTACAPSRKPTGLCYRWEAGDCLPTESQYVLLCRACGDVRSPEALRVEYEALRVEYEALRRPFDATTGPAKDRWDFRAVQPYGGKHECEKPAALIDHILRTSSREGAVVADFFSGSGVVASRALAMGRTFIGSEIDPKWCRKIAGTLSQGSLFDTPVLFPPSP